MRSHAAIRITVLHSLTVSDFPRFNRFASRVLRTGYLPDYGAVQASPVVFGWALLGSLGFGLLSGAYPAYRLARLPATHALKNAQA